MKIRFCLAAVLLLALVVPSRAAEITIEVGVKQTMRAILVTPDGPGPYPAVLVLHTSQGLGPADIAFAEHLAQSGYVALVPAFLEAYHITGKTRQVTFTAYADDIYADFAAAIATLRQNPKVAGRKVAALGLSNGGYFAMWLAATGKVDAGVSYYGALSGAGTDTSLSRFSATFTKASAPVLVLHGTQDDTVPVGVAQHFVRILQQAGSPHELKLYDGAGHEFERTPDNGPNDAAAADAWQRSQAFLARTLAR